MAEKELPAGYELVRLEQGVSLAMPARQVEAMRTAFRRRLADEAEAARLKQQADELDRRAQTPAGKEKAAMKDYTEAGLAALENPASAGFYRVLANYAQLVELLETGHYAVGMLDSDRADLRKKLLQRLVQKGPDRSFGANPKWCRELAQLERELPNFAGPIGLLRRSLRLGEATRRPVRVPPMLLLGPPGVGKTYFSQRVASLLGTSRGSLAFDQPTAGVGLRGNDKGWGNAEAGLLLGLICLGEHANPVVLLDELDKSGRHGSNGTNPLDQLHGALEPQTARCLMDVAVDIEFDASMVTYIGTANSTRGMGAALLSRFEVFVMEPCQPTEAVPLARAVVDRTLVRLGLEEAVAFERRALCVLAHLPPRAMTRVVEAAVADALDQGRSTLSEDDVLQACSWKPSSGALH